MRMQVQYHVSPKTGNAAPCNATQRQCRQERMDRLILMTTEKI